MRNIRQPKYQRRVKVASTAHISFDIGMPEIHESKLPLCHERSHSKAIGVRCTDYRCILADTCNFVNPHLVTGTGLILPTRSKAK